MKTGRCCRAIAANRDEDIEVLRNSVQFGLASLHQYVEDPEEVYFVKSPKSFLGASGLKPQQVALFEDGLRHDAAHQTAGRKPAARADRPGGDWPAD